MYLHSQKNREFLVGLHEAALSYVPNNGQRPRSTHHRRHKTNSPTPAYLGEKLSLQRQARRRASFSLGPNDHEPTQRFPFLPLLSSRPYRASRDVLYLHELLDCEYHAGRFGCMRMIHRLHASSQAECSERALDTLSERDTGPS